MVGTFQAFYDSAWHAPFAFWLGQAVFLGVLLARRKERPEGFAFFVAFTVILALDAWMNGALSPLTSPNVKTAVAVLFVLLGDFRFFYLLERAWLRAGVLTLVVPALVTPLILLGVPERYLWLGYEAGFFLLAAVLHVVRRKPVQRALIRFELLQYALWLFADLVLLRGHDVGWAIRIVPNLLYYTLFLPYAWRRTR